MSKGPTSLIIIIAYRSMKCLASVPKLPKYFHHWVNHWDSLGWINPCTLRDSIKQHLTKLIQHAPSKLRFFFRVFLFREKVGTLHKNDGKFLLFCIFESHDHITMHTRVMYTLSHVVSYHFDLSLTHVSLHFESSQPRVSQTYRVKFIPWVVSSQWVKQR